MQVLDVDMSGLPCGPKAAFATKGYFAKQRNRRGRQLGRVLASHYGEVVVDRLFDGKTQLTRALQPLVLAAEETLRLDEDRRCQTMVRVEVVLQKRWWYSRLCGIQKQQRSSLHEQSKPLQMASFRI